MLKELKKQIDRELKAFLRDNSEIRRIKLASPILYRGIMDFVTRDGKRIRPILFCLAHGGYSKGRSSSKKAIRASLATELLHDFLLIHDDVIDNSNLRRGLATMHRVLNREANFPLSDQLGKNLAIVAGDIIFALAVEALASAEAGPDDKEKAIVLFAQSAASTGTGEFIDVINNVKDIRDISEKEVILTYTLKTARYTFEAPLMTGAALSGAPGDELKKLSRLGILLGQAFQIHDDLLDISLSAKRIGKPILSDLAESKKTLLVWKAHRSLPSRDKKIFETLLKKTNKSRKELLTMKKLILSAGADRYAAVTAHKMIKESEVLCSGLAMKREYRAELLKLTRDLKTKIEKYIHQGD